MIKVTYELIVSPSTSEEFVDTFETQREFWEFMEDMKHHMLTCSIEGGTDK